VLEHDLWPRAVEHGVEGAHEHRMPQALEHANLCREPLQRMPVLHEVGADDLDDDEREEPLVPG
jgi:hypothetical protein